MTDLVLLQCFDINNRLRVRIISPNYLNNLNCKFPKNIRKKDRLYCVESKHVKLNKKENRKDFYEISFKHIQTIEDSSDAPIKFTRIFTDEEETCCICLSDKKYYVFADCGHYYVCKNCYNATILLNCPICRSKIRQAVPFDEINF